MTALLLAAQLILPAAPDLPRLETPAADERAAAARHDHQRSWWNRVFTPSSAVADAYDILASHGAVKAANALAGAGTPCLKEGNTIGARAVQSGWKATLWKSAFAVPWTILLARLDNGQGLEKPKLAAWLGAVNTAKGVYLGRRAERIYAAECQ